MAQIKSFTDIEQSKKLAEILPLESADMHYSKDFDGSWFVDLVGYTSVKIPKYVGNIEEHLLPCWSLAALLKEIPSTIVNNENEDLRLHIDKDNLQYSLFYENEYTGDMFEIETELYDDMIDACYELILKLLELNLL